MFFYLTSGTYKTLKITLDVLETGMSQHSTGSTLFVQKIYFSLKSSQYLKPDEVIDSKQCRYILTKAKNPGKGVIFKKTFIFTLACM